MPVPDILLDEVFAAANSLRSAGLIVEYSLGGALAAIRYTEPFTTCDADIFSFRSTVARRRASRRFTRICNPLDTR